MRHCESANWYSTTTQGQHAPCCCWRLEFHLPRNLARQAHKLCLLYRNLCEALNAITPSLSISRRRRTLHLHQTFTQRIVIHSKYINQPYLVVEHRGTCPGYGVVEQSQQVSLTSSVGQVPIAVDLPIQNAHLPTHLVLCNYGATALAAFPNKHRPNPTPKMD